VSFALCRAALSLWDGYAPSAGDLSLSLACYLKAMAVFLALAVYGLALGVITAILALPVWAIAGSGGAAGYPLAVLAFITASVIWLRLLWPRVRRYFFLQFFMYFRISDHPGLGALFREAANIDRDLKAWPMHLNVLCMVTFLVILGIFVAVESVAAMIPDIMPSEPGLTVANLAYLLAFLWPAVTAAGFYRLCLRPYEAETLPESVYWEDEPK
jgi:hypothetical protein